MKKLLLLFSFFLATITYANSEKYRLILNDDPATTITIGWNHISGDNPTVYYGTTDFGTDHTQYPFSQTEDRAVLYRGMDNRFVRLTGLIPNTNYYFVIHDSTGTSERFWFRTAPADLSRLSFIAGGDSRNNQVPRRNANLLVTKLKPHAVFFGGDMTSSDNNSQWQQWMNDWQLTIADDGRMFPIVALRGNHEGADVIYNLFDTPTADSYYAMTFGDNLVRTYSLNTEISVAGNQKTWLENDLIANSSAIWKVVQYHKPMRPHTADKPEGTAQYNAWAELFYNQGVRLVIDSDSHMVKTTWPVVPSAETGSEEGFLRNDAQGTVYTGEGCWGAPLRPADDNKAWTRNSDSFNQFKLIFLDDTSIEMRTIKVDNAESVGEVSNDDPFTLPANLDVWNPSEGDVVLITPISPINNPVIEFVDGTVINDDDGMDISLDINVIQNGDGIETVDFYVDDILEYTDNSAPYNYTNTYTDGSYTIKAIATDVNAQEGSAQIYLNIGAFTVSDQNAIQAGDDDVEETETGVIYFGSSDNEMVYDSYDYVNGIPNGFQKIGYRFTNLNIPRGAIIESAYIQYRSDEVNSEDAEFNIYAEASSNSTPFDDNSNDNVSGRTRVSGAVNWIPAPWTATGQTGVDQQSPELKTLLQQVIDVSGWQQGNSSVFMLEGAGISLTDQNAKRVADSYEGSSSNPPTLVYTYSFDFTTLSVTESAFAEDIIIYPNPFEIEFNIQFPNTFQGNVQLDIFDLRGRSVWNKSFQVTGKSTQTIKPQIAEDGIYFVIIKSENNSILATKKIIKQ